MLKDKSHLVKSLRLLVFVLLILLGIMLSACALPALRGTARPSPTTTTPSVEPRSVTEEPPFSLDEEPVTERVYPILLEGYSDSVKSAEFSPDGTLVVTANDNGTAIIWDVLAGVPVAILQGHSKSLTSAHFDDTGARVVTASLDGTARVWDASSGEQLAIFLGHEDFVNDARFDPGGRQVVSASNDGTARLWDSQTGEQLAILSGYGGPVRSAIFHPNGSQLATANAHSTVILWDVVDGSELFVLPESILEGQYTGLAVYVIEFNKDGSRLVAAGEDGVVNVWDTKTGVNRLNIHAHGRGITWADLSPDGNSIVTASFFGGVARIWSASDGSELATINHGSIINDVVFSTDGTRVVTVGSDPTVRVWDAVSGKLLFVLEGHTGPIHTVDFSSNEEELVTASADGTARIWNVSITAQKATQETATGVMTGLSLEGPWWAFAGTDGLWAVNADGTGSTRISEHDFGYYDVDITSWAASRGGHLAYITTEDTYCNASLHITSLPNLQDETVVPLTVDATEPSCDAAPGDPALDAVSVVIQDDSFAWSPDGRWLAFTGMLEGPTSDLYVYDTTLDHIARLTNDPAQASHPLWSKDGSFILHTALEGANIDTGMHTRAFWATAADGSVVSLVHEGEAQLAGWTSGSRFILYSIDSICGEYDLSAVDHSAAEHPIWEGYFDRMAYDPESGIVLVAIWEETASSAWCDADQGPGLFRTSTSGGAPIRIVEDEIREIVWSREAQLFFARTDYGILAVSLSGEFIDLAIPQASSGLPQVAAGTRELAWRGAGLWISSLTSSIDQPPQQIYPNRTSQVQWTPSGSHLLFTTSDDSLYVVQRPEFVPAFVSEIKSAASAVWVMP